MGSQRYAEECMIDAIKQITERVHAVADIYARIDIRYSPLVMGTTSLNATFFKILFLNKDSI